MTKFKFYLKKKCSNWLCEKSCRFCKGTQYERGDEITKIIERKVDVTDTAELYMFLEEIKDLIYVEVKPK